MDDKEEIILSGVDFDTPYGVVEFEISENLREDSFEIRGSDRSYRLSSTAEHNGKSYILQSQPVLNTLDKWLGSIGDVWCPTYRRWGVFRPKDELRQVLKGMIVAVSRLHKTNRSHGNLSRLENYALRFVCSGIGENKRNYVEITLIGASTQGTLVDDRNDLCDLIFNTILEARANIAPDLDDLRSVMKTTPLEKSHRNGILEVASHSALWHWKSKKDAYTRYWDYMMRDTKNFYRNNLNLSEASNWKNMIPQYSPFDNIFLFRSYVNNNEDFLNYIRNFFIHIDDKDVRGNPKNYNSQTEIEFKDEQYVEMRVGKLFPNLLQELVEFHILYSKQV